MTPQDDTTSSQLDQMAQSVAASYVDDYTPPSAQPADGGPTVVSTPPAPSAPIPTPIASPPSPMIPPMPDPIRITPTSPPSVSPISSMSTSLPPNPMPATVMPPIPHHAEPAPLPPAPAVTPSPTPAINPTSTTMPSNLPAMPPPPMPSTTPMPSVMPATPQFTAPMAPSVALPPMKRPDAPLMVEEPAAMSNPIPPPTNSNPVSGADSQSLEDQNIFHLLGIENAKDEEKEAFLDELQQVIWEDFLEHDVELLITEEEMVGFRQIMAKEGLNEEDRQIEMVDYLEKLVPDLEKIMLDKALELKEEMVGERIKDLQQRYQTQTDQLGKISEAQKLVDAQQWRAAADALNAIT